MPSGGGPHARTGRLGRTGGLDGPTALVAGGSRAIDAAEGAVTAVLLACREGGETGLLWEDRAVLPW